MKRKLVAIFLFFFVTQAFLSCKKDKNEDSETASNSEVNAWITDIMQQAYFWTEKVPAQAWKENNNEDPFDYFYSLLVDDDYWSYFTDDYDALMADLDGTPVSMGYFPIPGLFTGSNDVFVVVGYVYEGSPADKAGLKRGNIILKINDTQLTKSNYYDLIYANAATVTLGAVQGNAIAITNITLSMEAEVLQVNPVLDYQIYTEDSKVIGYVAVSEFIEYTNFKSGLEPVFEAFVNAGVNELIVDLRYNLGGSLQSAVWLASAIVNESAMLDQSLLTALQFNSYLQAIYENDNSTKYHFIPNNFNLNLDRAYFLTSYFSASASELVISGLAPYMDITTIGEQTRGKYVGSSLFPLPDETVNHNYGMLPIMFEYTNALGENVKDGIVPNQEINDDIFNALPLGDTDDPITAKAIELITGETKVHTKSIIDYAGISKFLTPKQEQKSLLIAN